MSKEYTGPFPEKPRSGLQGDERPTHIPSSQHSSIGHEDFESRMPHPFRDKMSPNSETGEGKG